jgi:hypothetical protein
LYGSPCVPLTELGVWHRFKREACSVSPAIEPSRVVVYCIIINVQG